MPLGVLLHLKVESDLRNLTVFIHMIETKENTKFISESRILLFTQDIYESYHSNIKTVR